MKEILDFTDSSTNRLHLQFESNAEIWQRLLFYPSQTLAASTGALKNRGQELSLTVLVIYSLPLLPHLKLISLSQNPVRVKPIFSLASKR